MINPDCSKSVGIAAAAFWIAALMALLFAAETLAESSPQVLWDLMRIEIAGIAVLDNKLREIRA
jgi:hypothetical protein